MKIRIITKKFTLTDDVREWVEKKLKKLDKFFP
ncbi:MAG: HPF/RaiA family ribosome-associated protein, partial [Clostridia bacterium]|nr:HPF/RaiA family ribosome-associated protein [Clostridia bacterium]